MKKKEKPIIEKSNRALRLIFRYEGNDVRLVSQQRVEMVVPPSDDLEVAPVQYEFWYELFNLDGQKLYRKASRNPITSRVEVPSDDPEHPLISIR